MEEQRLSSDDEERSVVEDEEIGYVVDNSELNNYQKEFIIVFETCPSLWNPKDSHYLDKVKKNQDLDKLVSIYKNIKPNATKGDVRKKINSLRSNYRKELKKIENSKRSGCGADQVYKPTSSTFHSLQFLSKIEKPKLVKAPWHNNIVMEFIEHYRREQMLWDPKHRDHKNKAELNAAWERIREAMSIECTIVDLKKKKESLMTAYRLHNRKKRINPEYQTSWFAFDYMDSFLGEVYRNAEIDFTISDHELLNNPVDHQYNHNFIEQGRAIKRERPSGSSTTLKCTPRKRPSEMTYSYLMPEKETRDDSRDRDELDECELYGRLLAKKMRRLDERQRDIAMHEIDNIMFRAKMNSEPPQQSHHSNYTPTNKMRKYKTPESPVFIVTDHNEHYEEEYLEDPMQEA